MRPHRLRFSGLRSYRHEADISFDDLDLFAVIGDTGAGKSTIIEAICLALYARKTWSGGAIRDVIADGCDVMRVEFTFEANGHTWTALRARRRSGASPVDRLSSATNHVPDVNGSTAVTDAVTTLLGLSCDQFTRAVVMPQGRFDELLRSTPSDRNQILKSILGLGDIVAASTAATQARDRVRPIHERFAERRAHLPRDPAAEATAAKSMHAEAVSRVDDLADAVDALTEPRGRLAALESIHPPLRAARAQVPGPPDDAVIALGECAQRGRDLLAELATMDDDVVEATSEADEASKAIEAALDGFADRDALALAAHRTAEAAATIGEDVTASATADAELTRLHGTAPSGDVDPALAATAEQATVRAGETRTAAEQATAALARARSAADEVRSARAELSDAVDRDSTAAADADAAAEAVRASEEARAEVAEDVDAAEARLAEAQGADRAAAVSVGHGPGDPCPVCDRDLPEGWTAPHTPDLDTARDVLDTARTRLRQADLGLQRLATTAATAAGTAAQARTRAEEAAGRVEVAKRAAVDAGVDVTALDEGTDGAVRALLERAETAEQARVDAETQERDAAGALHQARAELDGRRRAHDTQVTAAEGTAVACRQRVARHVTTLDGLPVRWRPDAVTVETVTAAVVADVADRLSGAVERVDGLVTARDAARERARTAKDRQGAIRAEASEQVTQPAIRAVSTVNTYLGRVRDVATNARAAIASCGTWDDLDRSVIAMPTVQLADVTGGVLTGDLPGTISTVTDRLDDAGQVLAAAAALDTALDASATAATATVTTILGDVGAGTVEDLHAQLGRARTTAATTADAVVTADAAVERADRIDAVLDVVGPFRDNLEVLCAALANNQFVDHLLGLREAELLAEASRRLRDITGDRFGFVDDYGVKNLASGELRSPDSLSGGERFQASLALALALVEIASRGAGRLDAVFIDEGFGSLDASRLDSALDTLGRVAGGGKMVGLISHLRPVAEYVDTVLHVTCDEVFGSKVRPLSEEERDTLLADEIRSGLTA